MENDAAKPKTTVSFYGKKTYAINSAVAWKKELDVRKPDFSDEQSEELLYSSSIQLRKYDRTA